MIRFNRIVIYRMKPPGGTDADRPTAPGGRGGPGNIGARGAGPGGRGAAPNPKKFRGGGAAVCAGAGGFLTFGGAAGAIAAAALSAGADGVVDATGVSPLDCSRPISRRGHT
jgi:hypothetical protein